MAGNTFVLFIGASRTLSREQKMALSADIDAKMSRCVVSLDYSILKSGKISNPTSDASEAQYKVTAFYLYYTEKLSEQDIASIKTQLNELGLTEVVTGATLEEAQFALSHLFNVEVDTVE